MSHDGYRYEHIHRDVNAPNGVLKVHILVTARSVAEARPLAAEILPEQGLSLIGSGPRSSIPLARLAYAMGRRRLYERQSQTPRDLNQWAKRMVDLATRSKDDVSKPKHGSPKPKKLKPPLKK